MEWKSRSYVMSPQARRNVALGGSRVDYALKTLSEGGYFFRDLEPIAYRFAPRMQRLVNGLIRSDGQALSGVGAGTFRTFLKLKFIQGERKYESGEFPRKYFITEKGKAFAEARKQQDRYNVWREELFG